MVVCLRCVRYCGLLSVVDWLSRAVCFVCVGVRCCSLIVDCLRLCVVACRCVLLFEV